MRSNPSHRVVIEALPGAPQPSFIRSLRDRAVRDRQGLFVAEGARFLCAAADSETAIAGLVTCPQLVLSETARSLIRTLRQEGLPTTVVRPEFLRELSIGVDSQGILLVLNQQWQPLPEILGFQDLWLGLETIRSPGNLGTLLRSADAAGGNGLVVFDRSAQGSLSGVDPYDPNRSRQHGLPVPTSPDSHYPSSFPLLAGGSRHGRDRRNRRC